MIRCSRLVRMCLVAGLTFSVSGTALADHDRGNKRDHRHEKKHHDKYDKHVDQGKKYGKQIEHHARQRHAAHRLPVRYVQERSWWGYHTVKLYQVGPRTWVRAGWDGRPTHITWSEHRCRPCDRRFRSQALLEQHVHRHHHVPLRRIAHVLFHGTFGFVYTG